ncbi:hypothetical protein KJB29_15585 [Geobacter grbiciae]|nr:hypothetical protein [Geobacter grbiciae]
MNSAIQCIALISGKSNDPLVNGRCPGNTKKSPRKHIYFSEYLIVCVQEEKTMDELLIAGGFLAFWVVLNKIILPRLGVPT